MAQWPLSGDCRVRQSGTGGGRGAGAKSSELWVWAGLQLPALPMWVLTPERRGYAWVSTPRRTFPKTLSYEGRLEDSTLAYGAPTMGQSCGGPLRKSNSTLERPSMYRPFPGEDTELGPRLFDSKVQSVLLQPLQICQSGWGRGLDTPFALYRPQSQAASSTWASTSSLGKGLQITYGDRRWAWGSGTAGCQLRLCHWPVVWP